MGAFYGDDRGRRESQDKKKVIFVDCPSMIKIITYILLATNRCVYSSSLRF